MAPMQEGMLFHALEDPSGQAYTEQVVWRVTGPLNVDRFQQAWDQLHVRYDALRSVFTQGKTKQALQLVLKERRADFASESWLTEDVSAFDARLQVIRGEERERAFDLLAGPLLRVRVYQLAETSFEVILTWHHILLDGWSTHMMLGDLFALYAALEEGKAASLPPLPSYAGYVEWLASRDKEGAMAYWQTLLSGYEAPAELPRLQAKSSAYSLNRRSFSLGREMTASLTAFAAEQNATVNAVLQTVWGILLGRYNDVSDVVYGAVVSGRSPDVAEIERVAGLLINTLPVRITFTPESSFRQVLQDTCRQQAESQVHQGSRLADVQAQTPLKSDLIKTLLVFENYPVDGGEKGAGPLQLDVVETSEPTNYDMVLVVDPGEDLRLELQYNEHVYEAAFVEEVGANLLGLLGGVVAGQEEQVSKLPLSQACQEASQSQGCDGPRTDYPRDRHVAAVLADQVLAYGERQAVSAGEESLTYRELDERSTRLANYLKTQGVGQGDRVALILDRSGFMVESMVALLKLGAVYVPIEPETPLERIEFIVRDAGVRLAVTLLGTEISLPTVSLLHLDGEEEQAGIVAASQEAPDVTVGSLDEAYLMYTSGSTGTPKAVRIPHRAILRLVCRSDYVAISSTDRMGHLSNPAFDAATFEVWGALLNGASLHVISRETALSPRALAEELGAQGVTTLFTTTALFNQMAREMPAAFAGLDNLLFGGEQVDPSWVQRVLEAGPPK
ncbi:MAG: condensation domain-containing protein, partial [Planctomycetota bacterium]